MRCLGNDSASMVLVARWDGRSRNGFCWQEAMGGISVVDCDGVPMDCLRDSNKNIRVYSWLFAVYACLHEKHNQMEESLNNGLRDIYWKDCKSCI